MARVSIKPRRVGEDKITLEPVEVRGFRGVNNRAPEHRLEINDLVQGVNVDLDDSGMAERRGGTTERLTGKYHSLWNDGLSFALGVSGSALKKITRNDDGSLATSDLRTDLNPNPVSYAAVAGDVYYANGQITGMVRGGSHRAWGVPVPAVQPAVSVTTGALYAGRYQVAITFVDTDGRESGATVANSAVLSTVGGLSISGIPTGGADIDQVRVYVTPPNGERLYLARTVSNGTASVSITSGLHNTVPLVTQFLNEPPAGTLVAYDNGRIFVADGPFVFYSLPHTYHLFDYEHYFHFPGDVTFMVAVPGSGIVTSSDRLRFFPSNFTDAQQVPVTVLGDYRALPGQGTRVDGRHFGASGEWAAFTTEQGVCVMAGREFRNLTHERFAFGGNRAAMIAREMGGFSQLLSMVRDSDSTGNVHVSDQASATVIRNGVIL